MSGILIYILVCLGLLILVCGIHALYSEPVDFRDWLVDEYALFWIGGTILLEVIVGAFIFWSWLIMLIITGGLIVIGLTIFFIYNKIEDSKLANYSQENYFSSYKEEKIYEELNKFTIIPNINSSFEEEQKKLFKYINDLKLLIENFYFNLSKDYPQNSISKIEYNNFLKFYKELPNTISSHTTFNFDFGSKDDTKNTINFFQKRYSEVVDSVVSIKSEISKNILLITGKIKKAEHKNIETSSNYEKLPNSLIDALNTNIKPYIEIYSIENFLRIYINIKYYNKYGNYNLDELFKNASKSKKKAQQRIEEDEKQGWKEQRGATIIFYVDFIELIDLITNQSNWDLFKEDFKNQTFIRLRIEELYDFRNKIAHNSALGKDEINNIYSYCNQIFNQLKNYNDTIKNWNVK
jgi:hypothetical protein